MTKRIPYVSSLERLASELEDGNYHNESSMIRDLILELESDNPPATPADVYEFLLDYNWMR